MAHILIFPTSIQAGEGGNAKVSGEARLSSDGGAEAVSWEVQFAYTAQVAAVNSAIQQAAIAAAEAAGYSVGPLDNKTLLAGAVGL